MDDNKKNIGIKLKESRTEQGLTLDDIQQKTKIQKRYLKAIEDGDFEALPGDFYLRTFIKEYARSLGLNENQLLQEFENELPESTVLVEKVDNLTVDETPQNRRIRGELANNSFDKIKGYLPSIIIVLVVLLIIGMIYFVVSGNKGNDISKIKEPVVESVSSKTDQESTKSKSSQSSNIETAIKDKEESKAEVSYVSSAGSQSVYKLKVEDVTKPIPVVLSTNGSDSWVSIAVNGTALWQGNLKAGTKKEIATPANAKTIIIGSGNMPATRVTLDNKNLDLKKANGSSVVGSAIINVE